MPNCPITVADLPPELHCAMMHEEPCRLSGKLATGTTGTVGVCLFRAGMTAGLGVPFSPSPSGDFKQPH